MKENLALMIQVRLLKNGKDIKLLQKLTSFINSSLTLERPSKEHPMQSENTMDLNIGNVVV
jgi:hypothetical protein